MEPRPRSWNKMVQKGSGEEGSRTMCLLGKLISDGKVEPIDRMDGESWFEKAEKALTPLGMIGSVSYHVASWTSRRERSTHHNVVGGGVKAPLSSLMVVAYSVIDIGMVHVPLHWLGRNG